MILAVTETGVVTGTTTETGATDAVTVLTVEMEVVVMTGAGTDLGTEASSIGWSVTETEALTGATGASVESTSMNDQGH